MCGCVCVCAYMHVLCVCVCVWVWMDECVCVCVVNGWVYTHARVHTDFHRGVDLAYLIVRETKVSSVNTSV